MTYEESAALMNDPAFRGRVKIACLKYAVSISNEPTNIPAHNTRLRWAQQCMQQPDLVAAQVTNPTVMDPAVQSAGSAIDDDALQRATEATVDKMM